MFVGINKFKSCSYIINKFFQLPLIPIKGLVNKLHSIRYATISVSQGIHCASWIWLTHAVTITVGFTYTHTVLYYDTIKINNYIAYTAYCLYSLLLIQPTAYTAYCLYCQQLILPPAYSAYCLYSLLLILPTAYTAYSLYSLLLIQPTAYTAYCLYSLLLIQATAYTAYCLYSLLLI